MTTSMESAWAYSQNEYVNITNTKISKNSRIFANFKLSRQEFSFSGPTLQTSGPV